MKKISSIKLQNSNAVKDESDSELLLQSIQDNSSDEEKSDLNVNTKPSPRDTLPSSNPPRQGHHIKNRFSQNIGALKHVENNRMSLNTTNCKYNKTPEKMMAKLRDIPKEEKFTFDDGSGIISNETQKMIQLRNGLSITGIDDMSSVFVQNQEKTENTVLFGQNFSKDVISIPKKQVTLSPDSKDINLDDEEIKLDLDSYKRVEPESKPDPNAESPENQRNYSMTKQIEEFKKKLEEDNRRNQDIVVEDFEQSLNEASNQAYKMRLF